MEAGLHVVFTLVAGVDKTVLALVVELHQHTHGAPLGPPEGAELKVLVPGQGQEGVAAVHQVAGHQRVRVGDGGQRVGGGARNEADHEENLSGRVQEVDYFCGTGHVKESRDVSVKQSPLYVSPWWRRVSVTGRWKHWASLVSSYWLGSGCSCSCSSFYCSSF